MAPKKQLYEAFRTPSKGPTSDDDILSVWHIDPKNSELSIDTGSKVHAQKTNMIFKSVRSAILDPKQIHLRRALYQMIQNYDNRDDVMKSMLASLESKPPVLSLYKFRRDDSGMGFTNVNMMERIFLCDKLSSALEKSDDNSPLETQLRFLVFNTVWHELAHWMHYDPHTRDFSGVYQRWKDFAGKNVTTKLHPARTGEAGFFVEGKMWGGVITFALPFRSYGKKNATAELYQAPGSSLTSTRPWNDIALVLRQPGDFNDLFREHIPVKAIAKRLTPGTIIEPFAANEFEPLFILTKEGGKTAWTLKNPEVTEDPTIIESDTRKSKRRKTAKVTYKERSLLAMVPDHINVLYATTEYVDSGEFTIVEEDEQN
ncbi:hypothetical protein C0995_014218 [Termitomyces sp. Mi166|nr:hypothetical protein C0995_014218 [Termitomyces sp. Mi166\